MLMIAYLSPFLELRAIMLIVLGEKKTILQVEAIKNLNEGAISSI